MKIAYVVAHPDDVEIWSGGLLLKYLKNSDNEIHLLYLFSTKERIEECKYLYRENVNVSIKMLNPKVEEVALALIECKPDYIITHNKNDIHPEHKETYDIVFQSIPQLRIKHGIKFRLFGMEVYNGIVLTNDIYIDITNEIGEKLKIIAAYTSQPVAYFTDMVINMNRLNGSRVGCKFAECYEEYPVMGIIAKARDVL